MHGERDVNLPEIASVDARTSYEACRLGPRWLRAGKGRESPFYLGHHGSMFNRACRHHYHARTAVVASEISIEARAVERSPGRRCAQNRPANSLTGQGPVLQLV